MNLSPMRYKGFTWPHNPRIYSIGYERKMAVNKVPFGTYYLQDLGRTRRVMRGEGEFVGRDAYKQFGALANTFYEEGPGLLIHPLWMNAQAYFVDLRLEQEPRPDYVRYSFTFWEATDLYSGKVSRPGSRTDSAESAGNGKEEQWYKVVGGDTLWSIASRYGVSVQRLMELNPQLKNPNLIFPGDEVRVA